MLAVRDAKLALSRAKRLDFLRIEHHLRQQRLGRRAEARTRLRTLHFPDFPPTLTKLSAASREQEPAFV